MSRFDRLFDSRPASIVFLFLYPALLLLCLVLAAGKGVKEFFIDDIAPNVPHEVRCMWLHAIGRRARRTP